MATVMASIRTWTEQSVERIGEIWIGNPIYLLRFILRLLTPAVLDPGRDQIRAGFAARAYARHTMHAIVRSAIVVLAVAMGTGFALGALGGELGVITRPLFEEAGLQPIFERVLPLIIASLVSARFGASLTAKLSASRLSRVDRNGEHPPSELRRLVPPYLFAGSVSSGVFYIVFALCTAGGYVNDGVLRVPRLGEIGSFINEQGLEHALVFGFFYTVLFGAVTAFVSCALGIEYAEHVANDRKDANQNYNAVWESTSIALLISIAITIFA